MRSRLAALKSAPRRMRWALDDRRLTAEQRDGVLGPAHRRRHGNSAADNRVAWTGWDWSHRGEEWTTSALGSRR
jgi:hypothetical protein